MNDDSELLFSVFVVQLGYASPTQVMAAAGEWATRRRDGTTLADVLQTRGMLDAEKRAMVEALMGRAVQVNNGDVARTLQSFQKGLDNLMRSISSSMTSESAAGVKEPSQSDSLEGSENVSDEPIGRYDFETGPGGATEELGRGGIGRVIVAHDQYLGRDVALKELLLEHTTNPSVGTTRMLALEQRFLREARLTGQLDHPAIVPVFELGRRLNGGLYYTMQRVRGRTMSDHFKAAKTLEGRLALVSSYLTTCQAIAYAHSRAVVHRDIKPQNVMIGAFGETFVLDWGLARVKGKKDPRAKDLKLQPDITGNVLEGGAIGTPSYMSPEQAEGKIDIIDERSDVWCLGAVLYELLTGRPPYTGANPFDVLGKIMKDPWVPVHKLQPDAPAELVAIAEKALARGRLDRYANAAEIAKDVAAWLQGGRVAAHDYGSLELVRRFGKRNKVSLTATAIASVAVIVFALLAYREVVHQRDEAREFAQLFLDDVSDKLVPIAGAAPLVEQLTQKTLDYYKSAVDPKSGPRSDRLRLGRAWKKIGRIALEVDKNKEAESAFAFALEVSRRLVDEQPKDPDARALLSETLIGLSDIESERGDPVKAEALVLEAVGHAQAAHETKPDHIDALDTLSRGNSRLAAVRLAMGRTRDAVEPARAALQNDKKLAALLPDNEVMQENVCISLESVSAVLARDQQLDEAMKLCDEAVQRNIELLEKHPNNVNSLRGGVWYGLARARLARLQGDADTATRSLDRAYTIGLQLVEKEPNDSQGRQSLALVEVQNGHAEDAFNRLHALGEAAFDADSIEVYAASMFFTGRYSELLTASGRAHPTTMKSVCTLAALAAALQADAKGAAELATKAGHAGPTPMTWPLDLVSERLEHPKTPLESRAWQLARQIDAAERKMEVSAVDLALLAFAHDVTQAAVEKR